MFKNAKITTKLIGLSVSTLAITLIAGISFISWQVSDATVKQAVHEAKAIAFEQKEHVKRQLEAGLIAAQTMSNALNGLSQADARDRKAWTSLIEETLKSDTSLSGAWGMVPTDKFDGKNAQFANAEKHDETGTWRPYYFRLDDGKLGYRPIAQFAVGSTKDADKWFNIPFSSGNDYVTEPYSWEADGQTVTGVSFASPLRLKGEVIGVAGTDILLTPLSKELAEITPLDTGSIHLLSKDGVWIAHPDENILGKDWKQGRSETDLQHEQAVRNALQNAEEYSYTGYSNSLEADVTRMLIPLTIGSTDTTMAVVVNVPIKTLNKVSNQITTIIIITGIVLLIVTSLMIYMAGNSVVRKPLEVSLKSIKNLIDGNYNVEIPDVERGDEIGAINQALEIFRDKSQQAEILTAEQTLKQQQELERAEKVRTLSATFDEQISHLTQTLLSQVEDLNVASVSLSTGADDTSSKSSSVAASSQQASSNVETVASASEELMASVEEIGSRMNRSTEIASQAVEQAYTANGRIEGLSESATRISEVVNLISDVAKQTNLLALNATIEAERAGESGKGFAVVAAEVKQLANQTAQATEEISVQIQSVQQETAGAVEAIKNISDTIEEINSVSTEIRHSVEQQGEATQEIAKNILEASNGTQEVTHNISIVANSADETGNTARQVSKSANILKSEASRLKGEVDQFLSNVRQAT